VIKCTIKNDLSTIAPPPKFFFDIIHYFYLSIFFSLVAQVGFMALVIVVFLEINNC
jgi:hypothetical protein